jgi:hypothetical protein
MVDSIPLEQLIKPMVLFRKIFGYMSVKLDNRTSKDRHLAARGNGNLVNRFHRYRDLNLGKRHFFPAIATNDILFL